MTDRKEMGDLQLSSAMGLWYLGGKDLTPSAWKERCWETALSPGGLGEAAVSETGRTAG